MKKSVSSRKRGTMGLEIIFEDRDLLVIIKEPGFLSNSPQRDQTRTAEQVLTQYMRKGNSRSNLRAHTVHQLDRDTSGLLVFAKSDRVREKAPRKVDRKR